MAFFGRDKAMKPQKITVANGRRIMTDYDSRKEEYRSYNKIRWKYDRETKRFYNSKEWRALSKQVLLEEDYICAMCGGEATVTDHIVPVKVDWEKRLDRENLQASCKACNDGKAIRERRERS